VRPRDRAIIPVSSITIAAQHGELGFTVSKSPPKLQASAMRATARRVICLPQPAIIGWRPDTPDLNHVVRH
jgi:hypothetical protein